MKKKIWINMDPRREDIQEIVGRLRENGLDAYAKKVALDDRAYVKEASNVDAALIGLELWDRDALASIKDNISFLMRKGAGYDTVDLQAATEFGIPIMNIPGINATAVAEVAFIHILNCSRQFSWAIDKQREQALFERYFGSELDNSVVGILGFGSIGKELARLLSGFRAKILVYDAFYTPKCDDPRIAVAENMEQVFVQSDYVSLHIPLMPETSKLIDRKYFSLMKSSACLINTARGGIVNEEDLADALRNHSIRAAGLDVVAQEPFMATSPLWGLDNAFVTPHIAGDSVESREKAKDVIVQTFVDYFAGKMPSNIVNRDVLNSIRPF